jgi:hypothetical protein
MIVRNLLRLAAKAIVENFSIEAGKPIGEAVGKRIAAKIWTPPPEPEKSEKSDKGDSNA